MTAPVTPGVDAESGAGVPGGTDVATATATATATAAAADASLARLDAVLASYGPVVVAFSGGADSALVAHRARAVCGRDGAVVVTAVSASLAAGEVEHCASLARAWDLDWRTVDTDELDDPDYVRNDGDRCARCKDALMDALAPLATELGATVVLGVNVDDLGDHRPGQQAASGRGARFPMVEAGLGKDDVRAVSRRLDLPTWDRPAAACLSSRLPYGTPVTMGRLRQVDDAEAALRALGFVELRVRHYDDTARIEVPLGDLPLVVQRRGEVVAAVRAAGYRYVTLDLEGLRSGNLNDALGDGA